jgi:hypothetical protein
MAISDKDIEKLEEILGVGPEDEKYIADPWRRAMLGAWLNSYKNPNSKFKKRYDQFLGPFMTGAGAATKQDLIPNVYKEGSPYDSDEDVRRKHHYNLSLDSHSAYDPLITAASHGLGLATAVSPLLGGGIGGFLAGSAIKNLGPLAWNKIKEHLAEKNANKEVQNAFYDDLNRRMKIK